MRAGGLLVSVSDTTSLVEATEQIGLCRECLHGGECPGGGRIGRTLGTQYASVLALDLVGVVEKGRLSSSCLPFPYTSVGGILSA